QPRLDAAHAGADHTDSLRVDVRPRPQVVDRLPQVPRGVVVERVLLPLARLRLPGARDRLVVGRRPLRPAGALAVVAGVDGDADDAPLGEVDQPAALALLVAARAVQDDDDGQPLVRLLRAHQ